MGDIPGPEWNKALQAVISKREWKKLTSIQRKELLDRYDEESFNLYTRQKAERAWRRMPSPVGSNDSRDQPPLTRVRNREEKYLREFDPQFYDDHPELLDDTFFNSVAAIISKDHTLNRIRALELALHDSLVALIKETDNLRVLRERKSQRAQVGHGGKGSGVLDKNIASTASYQARLQQKVDEIMAQIKQLKDTREADERLAAERRKGWYNSIRASDDASRAVTEERDRRLKRLQQTQQTQQKQQTQLPQQAATASTSYSLPAAKQNEWPYFPTNIDMLAFNPQFYTTGLGGSMPASNAVPQSTYSQDWTYFQPTQQMSNLTTPSSSGFGSDAFATDLFLASDTLTQNSLSNSYTAQAAPQWKQTPQPPFQTQDILPGNRNTSSRYGNTGQGPHSSWPSTSAIPPVKWPADKDWVNQDGLIITRDHPREGYVPPWKSKPETAGPRSPSRGRRAIVSSTGNGTYTDIAIQSASQRPSQGPSMPRTPPPLMNQGQKRASSRQEMRHYSRRTRHHE